MAFRKPSEEMGTEPDAHAWDAISLSDVTTIHSRLSVEMMRLITESAFSPSLEYMTFIPPTTEWLSSAPPVFQPSKATMML